MTTAEKLNKIEERIKSPDFIKVRGLGNEVPFYIFDYNPQDEFQVREHIRVLKQKINSSDVEIKIKEIDLFEVLINCLKEKGYLEKSIELEKRYGSEKFIDTIKNSLGLKTENNIFVKKVVEQVEPNDVIFITGVGKIYPIMRSHKLLNNLFPYITQNPLILFFPGSYSGYGLDLFDEIKGHSNYYKALIWQKLNFLDMVKMFKN